MMLHNNKKNIALMVLFIAVIATISITYVSRASKQIERENLEANLSEIMALYEQEKIYALDFSIIATFSWDRVYFFGSYSPCERIDEVLSTYWITCRFTSIENSDAINLIVFTNSGRVVQYLEFYREPVCDFLYLANDTGYSRDESIFAATNNDGRCYPLK